MLVYVRPSNEAEFNSSPAFSEAAGVVSTARIERPPIHRGGSASTETIPAASPFPSQGARSGSTGSTWVSFHPIHRARSANKKEGGMGAD